jgi:arylsulfatase A-like enzyme
MSSKKRPHIVLFNPDQWRGDVLGHLGNPAAVTPNLDRLAAEEAVSFRHAFCQNPVCTPSRCSFMTGWYPHVRGHRTMFHMLRAREGEPNLQRVLRDQGYYVWWTSRNDLVPAQHGWEGECDVRYTPRPEDFERWGHAPRPGLHREDSWRGAPDSDTYYSFFAGRLDTGADEIYADLDWGWVHGAREFILSYDQDRPLFLNLALGYPHPPYGVEEPWFSLIDRAKLPRRAPVPPDSSKMPFILEGIRQGQNMQSWTEERWTELRAVYYGMCARVDHQVGLIRDALKQAGMWDDTAFFFFSDHGDFTGDYGLVEKAQNTFQDCLTRVPFLIKPPRGVAVVPRISEALVELVDFSATVYQLTGVEPGYDHFGRNLLPVLAGETDLLRDAVFCEGGRRLGEAQAMETESLGMADAPEKIPYWPRIRLQVSDERPWQGKAAMCRTRTHKYVRRLYEPDELYDLEQDPQEVRNVIDDPAQAETLARLRGRLLTWYVETCDVVPWDADRRW